MSQYWTFRLRPLMLGMVSVILQFTGPACNDVTAGTLPKNPCALLNSAEIKAALAVNTDIGSGVPDNSMLPLGIGCTYTWGPRTKEWGESVLTITVIDASKGWPGVRHDMIQQGLLLRAKPGVSNAFQIPNIGDAAVFTFEARSSNAMAEAYSKTKDIHLSVTYHAGDALQNKERVIALLKQAAAKL